MRLGNGIERVYGPSRRQHVYQIEGLSESDREKICGLNALRLMNLDEARSRKADAA